MKRPTYELVYQVGIANVFRVERSGIGPHRTRVVQGDYRTAEVYCLGLLEAGRRVSVWHYDQAGDAELAIVPWAKGKGDLWADRKHPPAKAAYAAA